MRQTRVHLSVTTNDPNVLARAVESMGRAMAGMALEGVGTFMSVSNDEDED